MWLVDPTKLLILSSYLPALTLTLQRPLFLIPCSPAGWGIGADKCAKTWAAGLQELKVALSLQPLNRKAKQAGRVGEKFFK